MSQISIQSINLHNFKSFKGTHQITGLSPHFTSIIGPNGSGKSNIIDSILFVLGMSAKKMRHKINTDLIYKGLSREEMCYVEIVFKKNDSSFAIKRKLEKAKSIYYLNGEETGQKKIREILENEGIDMEHNRFLILQGEIESVSGMKPMNGGMLEYIEDVIGTNRYVKEIGEMQEAYEKDKELFAGKTSEFKFFEKEFEFVMKKKEENDKIVKGFIEKNKIKRKLCKLEHEKIEILNREITKKKVFCENELNILITNNKENKEKMMGLENDLHLKKEEMGKKEKEVIKMKKEFNEIDKKNFINEERRKRLEKNHKGLECEIENIKKENALYIKERAMVDKEIDENRIMIDNLKREVEELKNKITMGAKQQDKVKFEKELEKSERILIKLTSEKSKLKNRHADAIKLEERGREIENEINALKQMTTKCEKENGIINLKNKTVEMNAIIKEVKNDIRETEIELNKKTIKKENYIKETESKKSNTRIISLLQDIPGFIGQLGDLGTTKKELDIAVSTAGKGNFNSMVVKDTLVAEKCIEILKKNKQERTSFIAFDKIKECKLEGKFNYLIDHIECKEEYKKLFYFAIGDTILCENMEEAQKIAFGSTRRKVVTKTGQMIDKNGLMSGGGSFKGGMKISTVNIDKLEKDIESLQNALRRMRARKDEVEKSLNAIENQINEIIENKTKQVERQKKIIALEQEMNDINKNTIKKEFDSYNNDLKELNSKIKKAEDEIQDKQEKLYNLESSEIRQMKGEMSILFEKIDLLEKRNEQLKEKLIKMKIKDSQEMEDKCKEIKEELLKIKPIEEFETKRNEVGKQEKALNELIDQISEISEAIKEIKTITGKDFNKEVDLRNKLDEIKEKTTNNKRSINMLLDTIKQVESDLTYFDKNTEDKDEPLNEDEIEENINRAEKELQNFGSFSKEMIDLKLFKDFESEKNDYERNKAEYEETKQKLVKTKEELETLKLKRNDEFLESFKAINKSLKEIYQILTFGGNAELEMVDYLDPFSEGIVMSVMPPKKSWKNINMLSGGEKTLSSLALVFALHVYKPSPFYIMDEIDAALDYRNVSVISNYVYEKTKNSQFLIISLRNDMFEMANILLGIYKNDNLSHTIVFNIEKMKVARQRALNDMEIKL